MASKIISLFNHKGGVSKTTTTFNLGWKMAELGKRVLIVDTDPQCNLTGVVLTFENSDDFAEFYEKHPNDNIKEALSPAFDSKPERIQPVNCRQIQGNLFLLPGHLGISEYEVTLGIAQELSGSIQTLKNLPGSISQLLRITADNLKADYVLVDMSPSVGATNQNILMVSDYFIVPCSPDYFCSLAIDSLTTVIPRWKEWADQAAANPVLAKSTYPFPKTDPKFLGTIAQRYRPRGGKPAMGFQNWIDVIAGKVKDRLVPALKDVGMALPDAAYTAVNGAGSYDLAEISDFNSLITFSQDHGVPPFALSKEMIDRFGNVLEAMLKSRDAFDAAFTSLANKVITLTT